MSLLTLLVIFTIVLLVLHLTAVVVLPIWVILLPLIVALVFALAPYINGRR